MGMYTGVTGTTSPTTALTRVDSTWEQVMARALQGVSERTREMYTLRLREWGEQLGMGNGVVGLQGEWLCRESVMGEMERLGSASAANQYLSAVKKLVGYLGEKRLVGREVVEEVSRVKGVKVKGVRCGNWLTVDDVKKMLGMVKRRADSGDVKGMRDMVVLGLTLGMGLRREEASELRWDHIESRGGRMVVVDMVGKGDKKRSLAVPAWVGEGIEAWGKAIGQKVGDRSDQQILARVDRWGRVLPGKLESQGVWWVVRDLGWEMGVEIRPHDLRRTVAELMRLSGVELEEIGKVLGHSSVKTTERYLRGGSELGEGKAAVDVAWGAVDW